ncbi:hypothetical protein K488DRAFT_73914 [Vararia minispora EC-137]|uniref:Uncharacterized protein n=1 Tax=Vararia minispora EC-137 TaxID=1314806 RepID=A0ACB8QAG4_9AGAM|nr:hypothetical protein K488DRAFT_73914 [Vararia minispora EC-137]
MPPPTPSAHGRPGFSARFHRESGRYVMRRYRVRDRYAIHIRASAVAAVREIVRYAGMFVGPALLAPTAEMHALVDPTTASESARLDALSSPHIASLPSHTFALRQLASRFSGVLSITWNAIRVHIPWRWCPLTVSHSDREGPLLQSTADSARSINARTSAPRALAIAMPDKILVNLTTKLHPGSTGSLHWWREGDKVLFSIEADSSDVEVELDAEGAPHKTSLSLKRKASEELSPPSRWAIVPDSELGREVLQKPMRLRPHVDTGIKIAIGDHADSRANADANADDSPTEYSTSDDADSRLNVNANADDSPTEYSTTDSLQARSGVNPGRPV